MGELQGVRTSSLLAFADVLENLGERQLQVLKAINEIEPCSNQDIADYLDLPINRITPRCQELRKMGLVKELYIGISKQTGKKVIYFGRIRK